LNIHSYIIDIVTGESIEVINITARLNELIKQCRVSQGLLCITARHTTTALFVNEFEERLVDDIKTFFRKLVPENETYKHNDIHLRDCAPDEPKNAHSHMMAMLLSNSEVVPVVDGRLAIGQWQSILFAELDGPRDRTLNVQVIGQSSQPDQ
jgi:secondary thiamine-phosphate synthase enzyme